MVARLSITGLSKNYGSVQALLDVSFELRSEEVMALLGENGAGKSTLVEILAGIVQQDSGRIEMDGKPISVYPSAKSQAAGIAVVHQEYSSIPTLTVAENLKIGQAAAPWIWNPRRLASEARGYLEIVGLEGVDPRTPVEELSVAEMQLLEVARLLVGEARILIFDEPTAALSETEIARVMSVIRRLRDEGHSVIYVTHRLPEVFELADRVTVFRDGRSLPPVDVEDMNVDKVIEMMLGREQETMFPERPPVTSHTVLEVEDLMVSGLAHPVSFSVREGEIVAMTGQLGSGAGAVVQALAGVTAAQSGRVLLGGEAWDLSRWTAPLEIGVAYCSADRKRNGIFPGRPIRENLSAPWLAGIARAFGRISRQDERLRATAIAKQFAVKFNRLDSAVETLSGGNQQKVALGRWLGIDPRLILVEEPTRGVDVGARAEIYRRLRAICAEGVSVVMASSDTTEVLGLANTIGSFYKGRLTAFRPWPEWTEDSLTRAVIHSQVGGSNEPIG